MFPTRCFGMRNRTQKSRMFQTCFQDGRIRGERKVPERRKSRKIMCQAATQQCTIYKPVAIRPPTQAPWGVGMLKLQNDDVATGKESAGIPRRGLPGWGSAGGTAVAEPASGPAESEPVADSQDALPSEEPVEESPCRRTSTAILGGVFASIIFHIWLVAMLASLDVEKISVPDQQAFEAILAQEETTPHDPEEPVKLELAEPKDKEDETREAAAATSIGRIKAAEPRI